MSFVMEARGLGKQYGRRWALRDCTLGIPGGRVVGLVGPNGAGKTTLLHLAVGLIAPTSGSIRVLGANPAYGPVELGRVGFVAQDTPVYARLSVAQHLRMGAWLNPGWDREIAESRIEQLGLDPRQRAGTLSGALIRRTVPAMAVTLAIFAAAQVAMPLWVRPHLIPPHRTVASGPSFFEAAGLSVGTLQASIVPGQPEAWILSSAAINAAGQPVSSIPAPCLSSLQGKGASPDTGACMARRGIREAITYQPASRYWPFQWIETGIFLALALALAGVCFWRLGRRRT